MNRIDLDQLLDSSDSNSSIIQLDNFIAELCDYGEDLGKLTDEQTVFFLNQNIEKEINNGGFSQYFLNSSGRHATNTVASLEAIGATKTADIVRKAIQQLPDENTLRYEKKRIEFIEQINEATAKIWDDLDQRFFFAYEEDLNEINLDYVRRHRNSF